MKTFARIENGVVREVIRAEALPPLHPDVAAQFIEAPDEASEGWVLNGGQLRAPGPLVPPGPPARLLAEDLLEEVLDPANTTLAAVRTKLAARLQARNP